MSLFALVLTELTAELALFAAVGFLLFAIDDLVVDLIYFVRRGWRAAMIYSRYPKMWVLIYVLDPVASLRY
jgi:adsorption protein B